VPLSINNNGLEILEIKDGIEMFIKVIDKVVDEKTILFLIYINMGCDVGTFL